MDLQWKVAVVTGASMGIGRQVALDLARAGAAVVGIARGRAALDQLVSTLRPISPSSEVKSLDVSEVEAVRATLTEVVSRHGRLDVLVNNAAVEERRPVLETTPEDVERVMRINFGGVVNCTLAAVPIMVRQGSGRIVNVSSAAGRSPIPAEAAYCASKAAVIAFSESISYELEREGVRVQVLFPGYVGTTRMATEAHRTGQAIPPRYVHRTAEQVSRALLKALDSDRFEINVARAETLAPLARALFPRLYRKAILRTQPLR